MKLGTTTRPTPWRAAAINAAPLLLIITAFGDAMAGYQRERDEHALPMYEFTCQLATLEPPPPEMQPLFGAIHGNQAAMDGFVRMNAGTISPAQFFSPQSVGAILAAAPAC